MTEYDKKSRFPFLLTDIAVGILLLFALNSAVIYLDLREFFGVIPLCAVLLVPLLSPFICGKLTKRSFTSSLAFINIGILAAFKLSNILAAFLRYFHIIPDDFIRGLYEKRYPNLENEIISQKMVDYEMTVLFLLIEAVLLLLTAFTVKIITEIRQINKQINSYQKK